MNWVEQEFAAVARVDPDPDAWLWGEWAYQGCEHRWCVVPLAVNHRRGVGFFTLPVRTICTRCRAEA